MANNTVSYYVRSPRSFFGLFSFSKRCVAPAVFSPLQLNPVEPTRAEPGGVIDVWKSGQGLDLGYCMDIQLSLPPSVIELTRPHMIERTPDPANE